MYLILVVLTLLTPLVYPTLTTTWNSYYERQVQATFENERIPRYDYLSYLGRGMTYVPSYFAVKSIFLWVSGLAISDLSSILFMLLLNFFLAISFAEFSKHLKMEYRERFLLFMYVLSTTFILPWVISPYLHLVAYILLYGILAFSFESLRTKGRTFFAGFCLGMSGLMHVSSLFAFPFLYLLLKEKPRKENVSKALIVTGIACAFFLVFFSKNLMLFGLPNEIEKDRWGYLIDAGLDGAWADFMFVIPLTLYALHRAVNNRIELKHTHYLAAILFVYIFITYRLNIFLAIFMGVYTIKIFKRELKRKDFYNIALALCILSLSLKFYSMGGNSKFVCHDGFLRNECTSVYSFIGTNTPAGARVGSDPFYGHSIAYLSQRPVLADLYVEYADEEKYEDAIELFWIRNTSVIDKYNLSVILLDNLTKEPAFGEGGVDKVYDNGVMMVYVKP